jgi:hypothetical protein
MSEVMESHRKANGIGNSGEPESAAEGVAADGSAFGCGEDQPFWAGWMGGEVFGEEIG